MTRHAGLTTLFSAIGETMPEPSKLLVIGGFSAGKTHFGAQLLSRLQSRTCAFQLREASPNLTLLEEALARLSEGMTSAHTSRDLYGTIILPVVDGTGDAIDLVWPEFGGEQIDDFVTTRRISSEWISRVRESDSWIVMLRLMKLRTDEDLISKPLDSFLGQERADKSTTEDNQLVDNLSWSPQARLVEQMQMLLYFKEVSLCSRVSLPRISVLLSCWDELGKPENTVPADVLREYLPMFKNFLASNWAEESLAIYGLSALSKALKSDVPDEEFRKLGPESFGYVILPNGVKNRDLTLPIRDAVGLEG